MNVTVNREQNYWRAKCADKDTCAARTSAGNVGAYWRGPHRSDLRLAHMDAVKHLAQQHGIPARCSWGAPALDSCDRAAVGVVRRRGVSFLRCAEHHVDLRGSA